jgi:hypothetical protein
MRTINKFLLGTLLIFASCNQGHNVYPMTAVSFLIDKTDTMRVYPNSLDINRIIGNEIWRGYNICFIEIGNTSLSIPHEFYITNSNRVKTPKKIRKEQHFQFKQSISKYLKSEEYLTIEPNDHSVIFERLTTEIERLHQIDADSKHLLLYSDMMESDQLSFYNDWTFKQLSKGTESIQKQLLPLSQSDYSDITIYWVSRCDSFEQNKRYRVLRKFLQQAFSSYGIVFIPVAITPQKLIGTSQ